MHKTWCCCCTEPSNLPPRTIGLNPHLYLAYLVALCGPSWLCILRILLEHIYASFELALALRIYRVQPRKLQQPRVSIALLKSVPD